MKRKLLSIVAVSSVFTAFAQLPVGTAPQNKTIVLEEFTGIHCGYCPDGHTVANGIVAANPGKAILINIHSGSFANAAAGEPDFKTTEGTAIDGMTNQGITGYPAGTVNRRVFNGSQTAGMMAQGRGTWVASSNIVKVEPAYCNVALQGTINVQTRLLTVQAQVYYTGTSTVSTNNIHIMLLEDGIVGIQSNYGTPTYYNAGNYNSDGTYNHNHVLRKVITPGTGGLVIPNPTMGQTFVTTQTYVIPATYGAVGKTTDCMLGRLELVAFVTETDRITINASAGPIMLTGFTNTLDVATNNLKTAAEICAGSLSPTFKFSNLGSAAVNTAVFSYQMNGGAVANYSYTGPAVGPMSSSGIVTIPSFNFVPNATNTLNINVVSVNGATDQNLVNNPATNTVAVTTKTATSLNMVMEFTQDQYGAEASWKVFDEVTNALIASDGPFTNLSAVGTQLHVKNFTIAPNTCYKLMVYDTYGDGVNGIAPNNYGVGGYVLKTGTTPLITSNGVYGKGEEKYYKSAGCQAQTITASASKTPTNICKGDAIKITATGATTYSWTGSTSTASFITVTPTANASYTVMSKDPTGCGNSAVMNLVVNVCSGINSAGTDQVGHSIFPNPSKGQFTINANLEGQSTGLVLYNTIGQKVFEQILTANESTVSPQLAAGVYHYELLQKGENVANGKLIIE